MSFIHSMFSRILPAMITAKWCEKTCGSITGVLALTGLLVLVLKFPIGPLIMYVFCQICSCLSMLTDRLPKCVCINSLAGFTVNNTCMAALVQYSLTSYQDSTGCMGTILFQGRSSSYDNVFREQNIQGKMIRGTNFSEIYAPGLPDWSRSRPWIPYWCWKRSE